MLMASPNTKPPLVFFNGCIMTDEQKKQARLSLRFISAAGLNWHMARDDDGDIIITVPANGDKLTITPDGSFASNNPDDYDDEA